MTTITEEHLVYLDELRESGDCNMFGAGEYLQTEFGLDKYESRNILQHWMKTFEERHKEKEGRS
jgi:hypothetical protein